jgi:hypothetical protein
MYSFTYVYAYIYIYINIVEMAGEMGISMERFEVVRRALYMYI